MSAKVNVSRPFNIAFLPSQSPQDQTLQLVKQFVLKFFNRKFGLFICPPFMLPSSASFLHGEGRRLAPRAHTQALLLLIDRRELQAYKHQLRLAMPPGAQHKVVADGALRRRALRAALVQRPVLSG